MSLRFESTEDQLRLDAPDGLVAVYRFGAAWPRPFYLPVCGPGGIPVTRGWPVDPSPGDTEDHPHHKGVWVAHGDVNGVDNWGEDPGSGRTVHRGFDAVDLADAGDLVDAGEMAVADGNGVRIVETADWESAAATPLLRERRTMLWRTVRGDRVMDLEVDLAPAAGEVTFGDTKEGGLVSVRVATSMDASVRGRIENAEGRVYEAGQGPEVTWGQRSPWVDYSGPVGDEVFGVALFDHPSNPVHPTYWHVRGYGLFTANPFGVSAFDPDAGVRGDMVVPADGRVRFRYRMIIHRGTAADAGIADRWQAFADA